jgi:hypothetical protein
VVEYDRRIQVWFCCLNPREREVLRGTILGLALTVEQFIIRGVWETFWFSYPGNGEAVREAFRSIYGLGIDTIALGEPPVPVEVLVPTDPLQWLSWGVYLLDPVSACPEGCQQSRFS